MKKIILLIIIFFAQPLSAADLPAAKRREIADILSRIADREVAGVAVSVQKTDVDKKQVRIYASRDLSYYPFREDNIKSIYDSIRKILPEIYSKANISIYSDGQEISALVPMYYRAGAVSKKQKNQIIPFTHPSSKPLVTALSEITAPEKGLKGRHIALWQSHGQFFNQTLNIWKWQRVRLWQTCEDLFTQSFVLPYLVPMLESAGANVLLPLERDIQRVEIIADNDNPAQYREEGEWQGGGAGFAQKKNVYVSGENPFRDGTTRRIRSATTPQSKAIWSAQIPERGEYAIYVSYESTPTSVDDAHYTVYYAGGTKEFFVNQTMGGGTWIYIGTFDFEKGEQQVVTLSNQSNIAGRTVSADAVKIGGGYGNIARTVCDSLRLPDKTGTIYDTLTSGFPRYAEGARYWLQWAGFDEAVYAPKQHKDDYKEDYMSRAHWVNALMGGSARLPDSLGLRIPVDLALAFHSDAGYRLTDETIGTLGIYYTKEGNGKFAGGADRYRSRDLTDIVMSQIVGDVRSTFEPQWRRRAMWNRAYYEARIPGVPTMLLELLSHQNFADMRYGHDPRFKFLVSRAIYKGILRYLSSQYGTPYVVQPLPVEALAAEFSGETKVKLSWSAQIDPLEKTAAPTGYIVYTRIDEGGFDSGRYVKKPNMVVEQQAGRIYSYKVTAVNEGGESFPSEIVAACRVPDEKGIVLVVNGFERVSAPLSMRTDSLAGFYNDIDGGVPYIRDISFVGKQRIFDMSMAKSEDEMVALGASEHNFEGEIIGGNTFDYSALHGRSIVRAGYSFCSASVRAVERGEVKLKDYPVTDLILGKQRSTTLGSGSSGYEFKTFSSDLQRVIRRYITDGGAIFVSGSYIASDLWAGENTIDSDRKFAQEVLSYTFDKAQPAGRGVVRVMTSDTTFKRGEYRFQTEYSDKGYRVEYADALRPYGKNTLAVMQYADGRTAAVAAAGTFIMGFPFETITASDERDRLMSDILEFLSVHK